MTESLVQMENMLLDQARRLKGATSQSLDGEVRRAGALALTGKTLVATMMARDHLTASRSGLPPQTVPVIEGSAKKVDEDKEGDPAGAAKERKCLRCERMFASDGPGNRICPPCNTANRYAGGGLEEA